VIFSIHIKYSKKKYNKRRYYMELLTTKEVAKILRYTTQTLYHWRKKGIGPTYHKFQRKYLYEKEGLENFIQKNKKGDKT
jgi:predicted site-specific integrase-resolvase